MSSCSRISASVTVGLSSNVSMWLTARVLYFQNMVSTKASDRALVCNNTQRLLVSNCWKQTRPVHCVEPGWMQGSCTSTDCRPSCARRSVQKHSCTFSTGAVQKVHKYRSSEATVHKVRTLCIQWHFSWGFPDSSHIFVPPSEITDGKLLLINRGSVTIHHSLAHIYFVNQTQALKSLTIICLKHIQMLTGLLNTMYA